MFNLEKLINDIAKYQKVQMKKKKKKEITFRDLEIECKDALNKLIEKDKRELKQGGK